MALQLLYEHLVSRVALDHGVAHSTCRGDCVSGLVGMRVAIVVALGDYHTRANCRLVLRHTVFSLLRVVAVVLRHHQLLRVELWRIAHGEAVSAACVVVVVVGVTVHARKAVVILRGLRLVVE